MQSFRTEIENPVVEQEIIELEKKIHAFKSGKMDEDRFRSLRLARGVYGQRQEGVQMVRIKIPYGKISAKQLVRIADISDEYSRGNLHLTTRQDIQIHYVSLDKTPELWNKLAKDDITLREACGNTVRNVTASIYAGIDKHEAFDCSIYAQKLFEYFLRNPICQEMGRKFKIAFSSSEIDDAFTFVHDLGFIPKIKDGLKGFKVLLGGGIGSQPRHADVVYEFLETNKLIPFTEAVIRIFDQYGERNRRNKARMKFLIQEIGLEEFLQLVEKELKVVTQQSYEIEYKEIPFTKAEIIKKEIPTELQSQFENWKLNNVIPQKQEGYYAVGVKLTTGDIHSDKARILADIIELYTGNDTRITVGQNFLLRYVPKDNLEALFLALNELGIANAGFQKLNDIVACPGTDTCNLGIANSMGLSRVLEKTIEEEYQDLINEEDISIKISGCMNACGQHTIANIGFQGMTIKSGKNIAPASQVLLGGGIVGDGQGRFADKVLKVPSKRSPEVLRWILDDFKSNKENKETFNAYYDRQGKDYFYQNLKDYSDATDLADSDFIDWGDEEKYEKAIGVGECAGVTIDLVQTLFFEADEKLESAKRYLDNKQFSDSIYTSYTAQLQAAKALLTSKQIVSNSQVSIISTFDENFEQIKAEKQSSFADLINKMKKNQPTEEFAEQYYSQAKELVELFKSWK
ncbi:MAG: HEPN domain-containing protein [Flavobacteriales bacterium]|nr:HEPN domain-containing protein [Flavobacteriales bacterium]